jgi:hypothetical protein
MRKLKLVGFAALALLAFAAFSASSAFAEAGSPQLLTIGGNVTTLEGTFTATPKSDIKLVSLLLKNDLEADTAEIKLKNCEKEGTSSLDTTLCKDVPFKFTNVKTSTGLLCTNGAAGEVKGLLDLHMASAESAKTLVPLMLGKVLGGANGTSLTEPLEFKCGGVLSVQVKGTVGNCLVSPGLANVKAGAEITILCKVSAASDPELGKCEDLCEDFGKTTGFEASFNGGKTFEDVNELVHLKGTLNQEIFIDD